MGLYRNRYRIESPRCPNWDYSSNGYYFVTIVTNKRSPWLGKIIKNEIQLSDIGKIAKQCWQDISNHFPIAKLDEYIIMPDHIHGILKITNRIEIVGPVANYAVINCPVVETQNFASLQMGPIQLGPIQIKTIKNETNKYGPQSMNLGSIIRGFKVGVTVKTKSICNNFQWQPRYHDRIIRNIDELNRIRKYIIENPANYKK